jgi:hypothetical protein
MPFDKSEEINESDFHFLKIPKPPVKSRRYKEKETEGKPLGLTLLGWGQNCIGLANTTLGVMSNGWGKILFARKSLFEGIHAPSQCRSQFGKTPGSEEQNNHR